MCRLCRDILEAKAKEAGVTVGYQSCDKPTGRCAVLITGEDRSLFGNETEAAAYAEAHNLGTTKVEEIALKLAMLPKENGSRSRLVVITQGSEPVITVQHAKVASWPVEKLDSAAIVDTNGAGDAFVGGFLAQWVQVGWTVALLYCTAVGCRGRSWRRQCGATGATR